ncbi:PREDICTED: N-acetyltransferase 8-like [Nanorana parkeri]|uniref:N-acetyltransferase 8-like n=1 Tax=Nanorana parkeri TaxID=125878 RepID=UPI0008542507|nr:PREDICTED: N-acetyltransferase 8-like [Nanorana parkeri]
MSSLTVRQYKNSDFPAVKKIFIEGCHKLAYTAFFHGLKLPHNWVLMLLGFLLPLLSVGSIFLAILDVVIVLVVLWLCGRRFFYGYATECMADDMKDISKYYLQREGYNFWVVESDGELVGTVAAVPSYLPSVEKNTELKRMNVVSSHRGKGISKVLCRTVIEFAHKKGSKAVVLSTTTLQMPATCLYRSMGFKCTNISDMTQFTERLISMQWIFFRYDIPSSK